MNFSREQQRFFCSGVDLIHAPDISPQGKYPFLENARSYQEGRVSARTGLTKIGTTVDGDIHSLVRVNDYVLSQYIRFVGAGTKLYFGQSTFSVADTGYSGKPLSIIPYRPEQSSNEFGYIADATQMRKVDSNGNPSKMGIFPPIDIPAASLLHPLYRTHTAFDNASSWANHDSAGAVTLGARLTSVVIDKILYLETGGPQGKWALIGPKSGNYYNIVAGMQITLNTGGGNAETTIVEEVHNITNSGVSIAAILYDDGVGPGLCTVQPTIALTGVRRNTGLMIAGELVRVISVTEGPDGVSSFRCSTTAIRSAGNTITQSEGGSFVCYLLDLTHVAGESLTSVQLDTILTPGGPGVGSVSRNASPGVTLATVTDGSSINRPVGPDDYLHFSVKFDNPQNVLEVKLVLDVDKATGASYAATDGNRNAFVKTFRPSDYQGIVQNAVTADSARARAIQLQVQDNTQIRLRSPLAPHSRYGVGQDATSLDEPPHHPSVPAVPLKAAPAGQMTLGDAQWTEFYWKVADLIRLGSAQISDLSDIKAVQIRLTLNGNVTMSMASLWVGGGYGPDVGNNLTPLIYRYRYRASATGAKSVPGPATRSGVIALRQAVQLVMTSSSDPQVDKIDVERLGADNLTWHYVGSCPNASPTFVDDQLSAAVLINPPLETDAFMPFPLPDAPKKITVTLVGTAVKRASGDTFDTRWARGTICLLNGKATSLYASPTSTELAHIADSLGNATNAELIINQPILQGMPLPVMWGPFKEHLFACGDPRDAGTVYWTRGSDPDSAPLQNQVEVVSPTETMMNGTLFDARNFCWSDRRFFYILPGGINKFQFEEVANGKGLFARWAFCVGPRIWFLSQDGIYESDGGTPVNISADISPLFPSGDRAAFSVGTLKPVDLTQAAHLRLSYYNGYVFFDYLDTDGNNRCLVYDTIMKGWFPDSCFYGTNRGIQCRFAETGIESSNEKVKLLCGGNDGTVYYADGTSDDGIAIHVTGRTKAFDTGDIRAKKVWGDLVLDVEMLGETLTVKPYINNYDTLLGTWTPTNTTRAMTDPIDLNSGSGQFARNLGIEFSFSSKSVVPKLFFWSPSFLARPEDTFLRADDWEDAGYPGAKLVRGFLIEADTENATKGFNFEGDQTTLQSYADVIFNGQQLLPFAVTPPQIASLLRIHPNQNVNWRKFRVSYIFDKYPEKSRLVTPYSNDGTPGAKFIQGALIHAVGSDDACIVQYDGDQSLPDTLNLDHPGTSLSTKAYSFPTPFIAHDLRLAPSKPIRIDKVKWVWEPIPEETRYWKTEITSHGIEGWQFLKDGYLAYIGAEWNLRILVDGVPHDYRIPGATDYTKYYLILSLDASVNRTLKGKLFQYEASGGPIRLFKKDCEFRVHAWKGEDYRVVHPFGGDSFTSGADI